MSYLFSVTDCFTEAKDVGDKNEVDQLLYEAEKTKKEKIMSEHSLILP